MALVEWGNVGPKVLHATLDGGVTWQRVEIQAGDWEDSLGVIDAALTEAVQQLE
jgi:hypothetical protein